MEKVHHKSSQTLFIGDLELDITNRTGRYGEECVSIQPKTMQVLLYLAQAPNQLVSRQFLIDNVWQGNHYVGDKALANTVWKIRKLLTQVHLGDQECIETISKEGYRLLLPVTGELTDLFETEDASSSPPEISSPPAPDPGTHPVNHLSNSSWLYAAIALLIIMTAIGSFLYWSLENNSSSPTLVPSHKQSLTNRPGIERYPQMSPNGRYLAYVLETQKAHYSLIVQELGQIENVIELAHSQNPIQNPQWHPDSAQIIYAQQTQQGKCQIVQVSLPQRDSSQTYSYTPQAEVLVPCATNFTGSHALSHDGKKLAYVTDNQIKTLDLKQQQVATLYTFGKDEFYPFDLSWSPDNHTLAYTTMTSLFENQLVTIRPQQQPVQLTHELEKIRGHSWSKDGHSITFASNRLGQWALYQVNLNDQQVTSLAISGHVYYPSWLDHNQLLYEKQSKELNIAHLPLTSDANEARPVVLVQSLGSDFDSDYTPQQKRLVFSSTRNGNHRLWSSDSDGNQQSQIPPIDRDSFYPKWSPNGESVAYISRSDDDNFDQVFITNIQEKTYKQLTRSKSAHLYPTWSVDGNWVYASVGEHNQWNLWRFSLKGEKPEKVSPNGGLYAQESVDGKRLFYTKFGISGIWEKTDKNKERKLIETRYTDIQRNWKVTEAGIYYFDRDRSQDYIKFYDFSSQQNRIVSRLPLKQIGRGAFSFLSEENSLVFTLNQKKQGDIMLARFDR